MECTALWSDETHSFSYNWAPPMSAVCKATAGYVAPTRILKAGEAASSKDEGKKETKGKLKRRKRSADDDDADVICNLSPEVGPCRASFHRYFYDVVSGLCEPFIFGGCRGNRNNFKTMEECAGLCKS